MEKYPKVRTEQDQRSGAPLSTYVAFRPGKSSRTDEVVPGIVFVDYDRTGKILGVEVLAPTGA